MIKKSKLHLDHANESYIAHLRFATRAALTMMAGAVLIFIHAFIPALFQTSGSKRVCELADEICKRREKCKNRID